MPDWNVAGNQLTAAHKTLPFGTRVKVTNAKNNKVVIVTINDRGPTRAGRAPGPPKRWARSEGNCRGQRGSGRRVPVKIKKG